MFDIAVTNSQENLLPTQVLAMSLGGSIGDIAMKKPKGFKDIPGFEKLYAVDKIGRVYSYPNSKHDGIIRKYSKNKKGYPMYLLQFGSSLKSISAHKLVALTYIKNPQNKKFINHKNSVRDDNRVENLEWVSLEENNRYAIKKKGCSSNYKGVRFWKERNRWLVNITINKKQTYIGCFKNECDAAVRYNEYAKKIFGKYAMLNIIKSKK